MRVSVSLIAICLALGPLLAATAPVSVVRRAGPEPVGAEMVEWETKPIKRGHDRDTTGSYCKGTPGYRSCVGPKYGWNGHDRCETYTRNCKHKNGSPPTQAVAVEAVERDVLPHHPHCNPATGDCRASYGNGSGHRGPPAQDVPAEAVELEARKEDQDVKNEAQVDQSLGTDVAAGALSERYIPTPTGKDLGGQGNIKGQQMPSKPTKCDWFTRGC